MRVLSALIFISVFSLVMIPLGVKLYLVNWLTKNGADTAQIESLTFNPFTATLQVRGVDVALRGQSLIKDSSMVIDVGLSSIFKKDIRVERAEYRDLAISLEQFGDGSWRIGPVTVKNSGGEKEPQPSAEKAPSEWNILADHLLLGNCQINLKTPELDLELLVKKAELRKFTTHADRASADIMIDAELNGQPVYIGLQGLQVNPELKFTGDIRASGFDLEGLDKLLAQTLPVLSGVAGLDGKVAFTLGKESGMVVDYDGDLHLGKANIGQSGFNTAVESLTWKGSVHFSQSDADPVIVETDGMLSGKGYSLELPGADFSTAEALIESAGKTRVVITDDVSVTHAGSLVVEDIQTSLAGGSINEKMLSIKNAEISFKTGKQTGLTVDYDGEVILDSTNIDLPDVSAEAGGLTWLGSVQLSDGDSGPLLLKTDGTLTGIGINLEMVGPGFFTAEALVELHGKTQLTLDKNVSVTHEGSLNTEDIQIRIADNTVNEKNLGWQGSVQYDSQYAGDGFLVQTDGSLGLGALSYENRDPTGRTAAGFSELSWKGVVRLGEKQGIPLYVEIAGAAVGEALQASLAAQDMQFTQEKLSLDADLGLGFGEKLEIEGTASLELDRFTLLADQEAEPLVYLESLKLSEVVASGDAKISAGELRGVNLKSSLPGDMPLRIEVAGIEVRDFTLEELARLGSGLLAIENTRVTSVVNEKELASLKQLQLKNILYGDRQNVVVESVEFNEFKTLNKDLKSEEPALAIGHAILSKLKWEGSGLSGDSLRLENLQSSIVRDTAGVFTVTSQLDGMKREKTGGNAGVEQNRQAVAAEDAGTLETEQGSGGVPLRLNELVVDGKNNIGFEDYSLAVPFLTAVTEAELRVKGIDSSRPENKVQLEFKGELEKRAPIGMNGTVSPFMEKPALDLRIDLKNYPLTRLSPYTVQSIGTALAGGQLKLDSEIKLADDNLDMKNKIELRKLETKTISPELAEQLNNELPIPLDAALALLRDSKDDISLSIPFSGPVDDLNVGISDVLVTALSKAIVPAASGYLMYTLGPYGALAYVGAKVGEKMLEVRVPPVTFEPQQAEITDTHVDYLERIAKILKDWPKRDVQICPRVSAWEFEPQDQTKAAAVDTLKDPLENEEQLLELGQQRGEAIQAYLVDKHRLDKTRLLICDTQIELEKNSVPKVLLQL